MLWPPSRDRLLAELTQVEQHISRIADSIERQQQIIANIEAAGRGDSQIAETARALLATMQRSHAMYLRDRRRLMRLLPK